MLIEVLWSELDDDADPLWSGQYCLYAYLHARRDWLLYLGKANFASVRNRLGGAKKAQLFADINRRYAHWALARTHFGLFSDGRDYTATSNHTTYMYPWVRPSRRCLAQFDLNYRVHISPSYVADTIRRNLPSLGIVEEGNVKLFRRR